MNKKQYACGFLFDFKFERVVLIRKNKPENQIGLLNGVGGSIEEGETPIQAMCREFQEETGVVTSEKLWKPFAEVTGEEYTVYFFFASSDAIDSVQTTTDEKVEVIDVKPLLFKTDLIPNLKWLIPMCTDEYHKYTKSKTTF